MTAFLVMAALAAASATQPASADTAVLGISWGGEVPQGRLARLRLSMVAEALAARARAVRIEIEPAPGTADWMVQLSPGQGELVVTLVSADGQTLNGGSIRTRRGKPQHWAHTVALLAVEALVPVAPELWVVEEKEPPPPPPSIEISEGPSPFALVYKGLSGQVAGAYSFGWPRQQGSAGILISGQVLLGPWVVEAHATGLLGPGATSSDVDVSAQQLVVGLGIGGRVPLGTQVWAQITAAPAYRVVHMTTSGPDVLFASETQADLGVVTRVLVAIAAADLDVLVGASLATYSEFPRAVVDGERVLNLGHTTLTVSAGVGL